MGGITCKDGITRCTYAKELAELEAQLASLKERAAAIAYDKFFQVGDGTTPEAKMALSIYESILKLKGG